MTLLGFTLIILSVSFGAGLLGSLVGVGGGIIIVPSLTLLLGVDIRYAIGASIVSVIATSSGAAAAYVRDRIANIRVAMFLEIATVAGAISGALLSGLFDAKMLFVLFGAVLAASSIAMLRKLGKRAEAPVPADRLADRLDLHGSFWDESQGQEISYRVTHTRLGLGLMYVAGIVSGLLGVGSGPLKVPAMDLAMRLPIKVSTATSNFMIGVTAAASAAVYFARGDIEPLIAGPCTAGVLLGALTGSKLMGRLRSSWLRVLVIGLLFVVAAQMIWRGLQ